MAFIKIEKSMFGHRKIYDCNLCDTRKDYQTTSLQIESNVVSICNDCLKELSDRLIEYLNENKIK